MPGQNVPTTVRSSSTLWVCAAQTATDYGPYIQNLPSPLHTTSIVEACTQLLVDQWHYLRANVRCAYWSEARSGQGRIRLLSQGSGPARSGSGIRA